MSLHSHICLDGKRSSRNQREFPTWSPETQRLGDLVAIAISWSADILRIKPTEKHINWEHGQFPWSSHPIASGTWNASLLAHGVCPPTHELKRRLDPVGNKLVTGWRYSYVESLWWTGRLLCGFQFLYCEIHGIDVKFLSVMMSSVWCNSRGISRKSSSSQPRFLPILV